MRKLLSFILIILIISTVSFAEEISLPTDTTFLTENLFEETLPEFRIGGVKNEVQELAAAPEDAAYLPNFFSTTSFSDIIIAYIESYIEETNSLPAAIRVEGYGITKGNIVENYFYPIMKNPHLLLTTAVRVYDADEDGFVDIIEPRFLVSNIKEFKEAQHELQEGMEEYLALAQQYDTDVEKLLAIHDKMVELCEYDERVTSPDPAVSSQAPNSVYHALGVFRDQFAVCQGYSQAIYMLGQELGIEVDFCRSNEMSHMWNYIKLDGKWYYMDMTNDDPNDAQGRAAHTFFLFSEEKINPKAHGTDYKLYSGKTSPVCNDTKYDTDHFFNLPQLFKGYRESDGYYHAYVNYKSTSAGFETVIDFKSKSLYTGAVLVVPIIAEGKYTVTENGQQVQKTGTNLYMIQYPLRTVGKTFPVIVFRDRYILPPARVSMNKNGAYMNLLFTNAAQADLAEFTSFVLGENLTPYSTKFNWK